MGLMQATVYFIIGIAYGIIMMWVLPIKHRPKHTKEFLKLLFEAQNRIKQQMVKQIWYKKATAPYVKYGFEWLFREDD